jgi:hypothetical protein
MWNLGLLGAAGILKGDFELIASTILDSSQPSITFSNLGNYSSTYKHLQFRVVARDNNAIDESSYTLRFNSDTNNANYNYHGLVGIVTTVISFSNTSGITFPIAGANQTANSFAGTVFDILDAFSTSKNKTIRAAAGHTSAINRVSLLSGLWRNTDSITNISFNPVGNFVAGSRFSLYGIRG